MSKSTRVTLPFTYAARTYGYITWRKRHEAMIRSVFDNRKFVDLVIENELHEKKRMDWRRRRVSISYSVTRSVRASKQTITIEKNQRGTISVDFE